MNTRQAMFSLAAAYATPCAAFPADQVTTPAAFASSSSDASLFSTPRGLNEPVFWKSSAFRWTCAPVRSESVRDPNVGVRISRPPIVSRARRTSSRVGRSSIRTSLRGGIEPVEAAVGGGHVDAAASVRPERVERGHDEAEIGDVAGLPVGDEHAVQLAVAV